MYACVTQVCVPSCTYIANEMLLSSTSVDLCGRLQDVDVDRLKDHVDGPQDLNLNEYIAGSKNGINATDMNVSRPYGCQCG